MVTNLLQWILKSSADPRKASVFVIGLLAWIVSISAPILLQFGIDVVALEVNKVIQDIGRFIELIFQLISYGVMLYGGIRKIILTVTGENHKLPN